MDVALLYHCTYCNASFSESDELTQHSSEHHLHHCLYCNATFPQFDDVIQHYRETHPYHCYHCPATFKFFKDVIQHSISNHSLSILKIKHLELNSSNGQYGFRSHNFKVIPDRLKTEGKTIQPDFTNNELKIQISSNKSTDKITICSPVRKKLKPSDVETKNDDLNIPFKIEQEDEMGDEKLLIKLIPSVVEAMKNQGQLQTWIQFNQMLSTQSFPMDNIAFLLFLDVVQWYGTQSTTEMRYANSAVNKFWRIGYKMFHGKWLRYMSGPKHKGDLINGQSPPGEFDPKLSRINYSVPFSKVTGTSESPVPSSQIRPGIVPHLLDKVAEQSNKYQTFKLCFDGKKINSSTSNQFGDIDLFGYEGTPTLADEQLRLKEEKTTVTNLIDKLRQQTDYQINSVNKMSQKTKSCVTESTKVLIEILSNRLKDLRQAHLSKEMALIKFKKMAGQEWRKSKLLYVISALETVRFDIECCISGILELITKLGSVLSCLSAATNLYFTGNQLFLYIQANYIHLTEPLHPDIEYRFIKQRTDAWFAIRKDAIVTGSTLNAAVGLDSFKKQLHHFDNIVYGKEKSEFSETVKQRMQHGVDNEINAVATLVSRFLPIYYPDLFFYEEGCYKVEMKERKKMIVSPDGSCRDANDKAVFAVEIKCPAPREGVAFKTRLHYSLPKYYVPQVLSEMFALDVDQLLYVCYTSESTSIQKITFCPDLWTEICTELEIFTCTPLRRPTRRSANFPILQDKISSFIKNNVTFLCELQSCTGVNCRNSSETSTSLLCRHKSNEIPNSTISIQSVQTLLHDSEKKIESAYNLTRTRASEYLGFMISDVDRNYREEEFHSVPIAFGLKGYSLSNKVMREMMEYVLLECHNRGLYTPVCSFDGQWYRMTVHDQNDSPLTLLQLQKEIWDCVKKLAKKDILKEITSANVVSVSDYLSLSNRVNITKCVKTIDVNKKELVINSFLVGKVKGEKTFMVSNNIRRLIKEATSITGKTKTVEMTSDEKEINSTRANDIMSSLPEEIESNLTEEVADQVIEVVSSLSKTKISGILKDDEMVDVNIEDLFSDQFPETNDHAIDENFDSNNNNDQDIEMDEDEVHKTTDIPSEEQENPWNNSEKLISESDIHNMLKAVQTTGKTKKSWDISVQEFEQKFQNANSIDKSFTKAELVLCMQPVVGKLKSKGVTCKSSLPKHELVSVMSKCLGDGTVFHNKKYKKKNPESLKSMCKKSIHKMPKLVLNSFYAENIYAEKLEDWYSSSPFGAHVNIQNQNSIKNKMWYSKPEFNSTLGHYLFLILDSYHQLCGARRLVCQNGIPAAGIKKGSFP